MSKNIKAVALGLATSLVAPIASLASNQISADENTVKESSKLSRAVSSLDKSGKVIGVSSNDYLNVRSQAVTSSSSIGKLSNGETVIITGKDDEWYRINYKNKTGYVYENYIKIEGDIVFKKTTDNLNFRTGPSTSHTSMGKIPTGTTVRILSTSNGWSRVYYDGNFGYCSDKYLVANSSSTNSNQSSSTNTSTSITSMNKEGQVTGVASNDKLNVRSQADADSSIVSTLSNGAIVQVTGQDVKTKWYKVVANGKTGYVNNRYIKINGDWNSSSSVTTTTKYTTDNLNLRTGAGTSYSIILSIPKGSAVQVYSVSNGWAKVRYNNQDGYVNNSYLSTTQGTSSSTVKKVTTANVNMRTGASTSHPIIKTVASNTTVEVISTSGQWDKVRVGSDTGYMNNSYLKSASSSSSSNSGLTSSKTAYSKIKVVVDAGHGGSDPGAVGNGVKEKDIVLSISKKVNSKLQSLGFKTVMTRNTDKYLTLSSRYSTANSNSADLFVSIHANSSTGTSAKGIETLYKGAKALATDIQNGMLKQVSATNRGVKYRSDLAVLNGTKMPSALVEVGFISNASECAQIANNSYQEKLAVGITNGIAKYTDDNLLK